MNMRAKDATLLPYEEMIFRMDFSLLGYGILLEFLPVTTTAGFILKPSAKGTLVIRGERV
jgi:hypothetical protein